MKRYLLAVVLFAACGGCVHTEVLSFPRVEYRLQNLRYMETPPAQYAQWWLAAVFCSQTVNRSYDEVTWYVADAIESAEILGDIHAIAAPDQRAIYIQADHIMDERVVKHEMLHVLGFSHDHLILWKCSNPPVEP